MKKRPDKYDIVIAICATVLIAVGAILISERVSGMKADRAQNAAKQLMEQGMQAAHIQPAFPAAVSEKQPEPTERPESTEDPEPSEQPEAEEDPIPENEQTDSFLPLLAQNADFVGWLTAGETIDYPVVQSDNQYYLTRNFFDERDKNGVPFMDEHNSLTPKDDVLIIYGHNMKSGAMFGRLNDYLEYDYLSKYPVVSFRTIHDEDDVFYTPIAAFELSAFRNDRHYFDVKRINFDSDEAFQSYLDEVTVRSAWKAKVDAEPGDRLLALMTCSYIHDYGRLLLVCRELREEEIPASVKALYSDLEP